LEVDRSKRLASISPGAFVKAVRRPRIGGKAMRETIFGEAALSLLIKSCGS